MTAEQAISWLSLKPKDLPVFVLIGTDPLASVTIGKWATLARIQNVKQEKIVSAMDVAMECIMWPDKHLPG